MASDVANASATEVDGVDSSPSPISEPDVGDLVAAGGFTTSGQPGFRVKLGRRLWADSVESDGEEHNAKKVQTDDVEKRVLYCACTLHEGPRGPMHKFDVHPVEEFGSTYLACKTCFEQAAQSGKAMGPKEWKKKTRRYWGSRTFTACAENGLTRAGRRGRFVSYYVRQQSTIEEEARSHGIADFGLKEWLLLCQRAWEESLSCLPSVLMCVGTMKMADSAYRVNRPVA